MVIGILVRCECEQQKFMFDATYLRERWQRKSFGHSYGQRLQRTARFRFREELAQIKNIFWLVAEHQPMERELDFSARGLGRNDKYVSRLFRFCLPCS